MRGNLSGYGQVWYFPNGIANILALSHVKEKFIVTYDSALDNTFYVHKPEKLIQFREARQRLYYFDAADRAGECTTLVTTVDDNKSKLSAYDYTKDKLARDIYKQDWAPQHTGFHPLRQQQDNCKLSHQLTGHKKY